MVADVLSKRWLLAAQDHGSFDWGAIGAAVGTFLAGVAGTIGVVRSVRGSSKGPEPGDQPDAKPVTADDDERAIETLRQLVSTLQDENARLWQRNSDQELRYDALERRCSGQDTSIRELRAAVARLRNMLVQHGIDPGQT